MLIRKKPPLQSLYLIAIILIATAALGSYAVARHQRLNSTGYDLAIKAQVAWQLFQGNGFQSSFEVNNYLGDHLNWTLALVAPLFFIWEDIQILLWAQAFMLSLGALPAFRIAQRAFQSDNLGYLFAILYLFFPAIGFINRFDFHPIAFVPCFLLFAYDAADQEQNGRASFWLILALLSREEIGLTITALGIYFFIARRSKIMALWAFLGVAYSLIGLLFFIPLMRGGDSDTLSRYGWLGGSTVQIIQSIVTQPLWVTKQLLSDPLRQRYLLKSFAPFGFLSLLSPTTLIAAPAFAYNLLSSRPSQHSIYFQYIAPAIPFLYIGAVQGAKRLRNQVGMRPVAGIVLAGMAAAWALDNPISTPVADPYYELFGLEERADAGSFWKAQSLIPPDSSIAAMNNYAPHFALRPDVRLFYDANRLWDYRYGLPPVDYYLLHLNNVSWGLNHRLFLPMVETAIGQMGYEAIFFQDDVAVLARGAPPQPATGAVLGRAVALAETGGKFVPTSPEKLSWMAEQWLLSELPAAVTPYHAPFSNSIILEGFQLSETPAPSRPLCVTLFWATTTQIAEPFTMFVHLIAPDGSVIAQRDAPPALGFSPTETWRPGDIISDMHCLVVPSDFEPSQYGINVGIYHSVTRERMPAANGNDVIPLPTP